MKIFREVARCTKPREPVLERVIQLAVSIPLLSLIFRFTKSKKIPYILTFLMFLFGVLGSAFLLKGYYTLSALMFLLSVAFDKMDGTSSRYLFGKDPEMRGTLDFVLGHLVGVLFLTSLLIVLMRSGAVLEAYAMLVFIGLFMLFLGLQSTKFRLFATYNLDERRKFKGIKLSGFLEKIWDVTNRYGVKPFPTECDAFILLEIVLPLIGFNFSLYFIVLAILSILAEIFVLIYVCDKIINRKIYK